MALEETAGDAARLLPQLGSGHTVGSDEACGTAEDIHLRRTAPASCRVACARVGLAGLTLFALLLCCEWVLPHWHTSSSDGLLLQPMAESGLIEDLGGSFGDNVSQFIGPVTAALSGDQGFVVFRSGDLDYGPGFGDRLAGIFGAAYLAMTMHKTLKVDWPELAEVFVENKVSWHFDANELGIAQSDQDILGSHGIGKKPNFPDPNFEGLSGDVVVFDGYDVHQKYDEHWRQYPSDVSNEAQSTRVVVVGANRAGTEAWFWALQKANQGPPPGCTFWEFYHAIFVALFKPSPAFMGMEVTIQVASLMRPMYRAKVSLSKAIRVLSSPDTFSLGIHIRKGDDVIKKEIGIDPEGGECEKLDPDTEYAERLQCAIQLAKLHPEATKRVMMIFSDSLCVRKHIMDYFENSEAFTEVWTQEITGSVNMDSTMQNAQDDEKHAWTQTVLDWTLMRHVDVFAITTSYWFVSGFPASALVTSSPNKLLYDLKTCKRMDQGALCAERFC